MKLPESTEWVLHCAASVAQLEESATVSTARLAEHFALPAPYLAKQLAHLVRAGIFTATTGPRGGFRLGRPADRITLYDLVEAVSGSGPRYVCREIRQQGRGALPPDRCREVCPLAAAMWRADEVWRAELQGVTLADVIATLPPGSIERTRSLLTG